MKTFVGIVLAICLASILDLGAGGAFISPPADVPIPIAIGAAVPLIIFLGTFSVSAAFRDRVGQSFVRCSFWAKHHTNRSVSTGLLIRERR